MKKLLLFAAALFMLGTTNAQDYKPVAGSKNLEFQLAPLGGSPISIGGIRYRQFMTDKSALRLNVFIGGTSSKSIDQQEDNSTTPQTPELTTKNSTMVINLRPGFEKHLEGTDKLSPYFGGEVDFALGTSKKVQEKSVLNTAGTAFNVYEETTTGENGYMRIGLNLVGGFDYYFAKKLYVGGELGFGFAMNNESKIKFESTQEGFISVDPQKQGSSMSFGPNVVGQLRLGFIF